MTPRKDKDGIDCDQAVDLLAVVLTSETLATACPVANVGPFLRMRSQMT